MGREVSVEHMTGSFEVSVSVLFVLFMLYFARRLNAMEASSQIKIEEGSDRLNAAIKEAIGDLTHSASAMIEEELPNAFEQIELMRQQMVTQVMGWGLNMLMQKFGGEGGPELAIAEIEQKD